MNSAWKDKSVKITTSKEQKLKELESKI